MVAKYREDNKEILSQTPPPALKVSELISPFAATAGDAPAPTLAEVPSAGLGASGSDIFIFLVIGGLSVLGALLHEGEQQVNPTAFKFPKRLSKRSGAFLEFEHFDLHRKN